MTVLSYGAATVVHEFSSDASEDARPVIIVEQDEMNTPYGKAKARSEYRVLSTAAGPMLAVGAHQAIPVEEKS